MKTKTNNLEEFDKIWSEMALVEKVGEIRNRFKCAACDGAKCGHTLSCQTLDQAIKIIQQYENKENK